MRYLFILFSSFFVFGQTISAQVVYADPIFFEATDAVDIYFDATQGTGGLAGYTGDVYAHTGVITDASSGSSDWKYVKTAWGENTPETKLTKIADDLYRLTIEPSIDDYYGVESGEEVLQLAFVFRSEDNSLEGKDVGGSDIFLDLYLGGLQVAFTGGLEGSIVVPEGESLAIEALATQDAQLILLVNDAFVTESFGTVLNYILPIVGNEVYEVKVEASEGGTIVEDVFTVVGQGAVVVEDLPEGMKDGINYLDDETVLLSLYAPDKDFVYVLGDFNNWAFDPATYMKRTPDGLRYWLEIDGLTPQQEYAYQYLIDGNLQLADPYAEKILDPWRDNDIPDDTYPNLIDYPTGQGVGIVSVLQTAQEDYTWVNDATFERPAKTDLVIYELLIRDYFEDDERTFQNLIDTLDYLQNLGINAIELMPIMEFENNNSWGYNPSFMLAVDKYYGTKNKFKELVDACHGRGMAVILDVVLNHQFGQSPLVQMYPLTENPWFNPVATHDFNVGYDMNHDSPATEAFVERVLTHWINEFNIDGFRFDLSKGFTQNNTLGNVGAWGQYDAERVQLWKDLYDFMQAESEGLYVILEHFSDNSEEVDLANYGMMIWGNLNHEYLEASMGYSSSFNWASYQTRGYNEPNLITYMESHDEERMLYKNLSFGNANGLYDVQDLEVALERAKLAAAFFFTIPGPKMLWEFEELGYDYSINACPNGTVNESCRTDEKPVRWDYLEEPARKRVHDVFKNLIHLKTNYDAFRTSNFDLDVTNKVKRINLYHPDMNVTVVGNFDVSPQTIDPNFASTGTWFDYFSGESMEVSNTNANLTLKQGEFHIYTSEPLPTPENDLLDFSIYTPSVLKSNFSISIQPNPITDQATFQLILEESSTVNISIFNAKGEQVKTWETPSLSAGTHNMTWDGLNEKGEFLPNGCYMVQVVNDGASQLEKVVLMR